MQICILGSSLWLGKNTPVLFVWKRTIGVDKINPSPFYLFWDQIDGLELAMWLRMSLNSCPFCLPFVSPLWPLVSLHHQDMENRSAFHIFPCRNANVLEPSYKSGIILKFSPTSWDSARNRKHAKDRKSTPPFRFVWDVLMSFRPAGQRELEARSWLWETWTDWRAISEAEQSPQRCRGKKACAFPYISFLRDILCCGFLLAKRDQ